jgi:deazaflavin-dependent oxidoreductase (nitroreductase family)
MTGSRLQEQGSPSGIRKFLFRIPIYVYKAKLGFLLGKRFVLVGHTGRKSGLKREVVLEVVAIRDHSVFVASGWGDSADWYQNVLQHPEVTIQIGSKRRAAISEAVSVDEARSLLASYEAEHPKTFRRLGKFMLDVPGESPPDVIENLATAVPFVRFRPR